MLKRFASRLSAMLPDTLPSLRGAWLKAYTGLWIAVIAVAVFMTGLNAWQGLQPFEYTYGHYGFSSSGSGDRLGAVVGSEAIAKGFQAGDIILAIDGVPMEKIGTAYLAVRKALIKNEGETTAFTVRSTDGNVRTKLLTRLEENTRRAETSRKLRLGLELAADFAFFCAAIMLFRRRREPVPAILALSFTMVLATPNFAADVWLDGEPLTAALDMVGTIGFAMLWLGLLAFPDGRMPRMAWALACVIFIWGAFMALFPGSTMAELANVTGTALFAAAVVRLILRYLRLPAGINPTCPSSARSRTKSAIAGSRQWTAIMRFAMAWIIPRCC
jgi:hypothetical protein